LFYLFFILPFLFLCFSFFNFSISLFLFFSFSLFSGSSTQDDPVFYIKSELFLPTFHPFFPILDDQNKEHF